MSGSVPSWSIAVQCVVAGTVLGLVALQAGWVGLDGAARRANLRGSGHVWSLVWSVALAAVTLVNGLIALLDPSAHPLLLTLRFVALGASVTLGPLAIRGVVGGPSVRGLVVGTATWYAVALGLWLGTDLLVVGIDGNGLPVYGALATVVDLGPVVAIALYVGVVLRTMRLTSVGAIVTVTGFLSAALLVASSVPPPTALTELLKGVWAVPLVVGLQVLASCRLSQVRRAAARRQRLRAAVTQVSAAAWSNGSPQDLLVLARDVAREHLADATVQGALRTLPHDRRVAELWSVGTLDADGQMFLTDLGRIVSTAAEREALTARLRRASFVDVLTDLPTRAALDEHLVGLLADQTSTADVAVVLVDVEGLKLINDRRGHGAGDDVLMRTARHLRDALGTEAFLARVGGDEFAGVLTGPRTADDLRAIGRLIRETFTVPMALGTHPRLTVGLAHAASTSPAELQSHASQAMVEARRTHAGVAYFDDRLREREAFRESMRTALERAVAQDRIVAHFQPVADPVTLQVVGMEALARWQDGPTLRSPAAWLPLAEESGLIVDIGKAMFRAARAGMERFGLPVAVNVAARQLDEPDVIRHIEEAWGHDAWDRLTIEVTESALVHDAAHVRAALTELSARGAKISLDDFGTGYNSLARLGDLPLHSLKIDRSLLENAVTSEGVAVLRAVVALAEAHGLEVVAEGVERRSQLTALIDLGVHLVQGNLVGRPSESPVRRSSAPTQRPPSTWLHAVEA